MIDHTEHTLHAACSIHGNPIPVSDDACGSLWLYRTAGGYQHLVRSDSFESALEAVYDDMPTVPEEDIHEAYGFCVMRDPLTPSWWCLIDEACPQPRYLGTYRNRREAYQHALGLLTGLDGRDLAEGYTYQANASGTGIVARDLNGEDLREVSPQELVELGIIPIWED